MLQGGCISSAVSFFALMSFTPLLFLSTSILLNVEEGMYLGFVEN
jgi:hypothetical protein